MCFAYLMHQTPPPKKMKAWKLVVIIEVATKLLAQQFEFQMSLFYETVANLVCILQRQLFLCYVDAKNLGTIVEELKSFQAAWFCTAALPKTWCLMWMNHRDELMNIKLE